jgi:hypothetical protein
MNQKVGMYAFILIVSKRNETSLTNAFVCYMEYGRAYPSDTKCKVWMEDLHDPVFGHCDVLRFSWAPTKNKLLEKGVPRTFKANLDNADEVLQQQKGMTAFLG